MLPYPVLKLIDLAFQSIYLALLVRVLLSWIPHNSFHPIIDFIYRVTDPILKPFRDMIPAFNGIDLSPLLAWMGLGILQRLIYQIFW